MLEVIDLKKKYSDRNVVDGLSFKIKEGSCFGILGPNGAGKTTTLEILEGLTIPDSGQVLFLGEQLNGKHREKMGIQLQQTQFQDFLTVEENIELFSNLYSSPLPKHEVIKLCALGGFLNKDTRTLSGGQKQRLSLALALLPDPEIIILDEPTTGLDPQARRTFWNLIISINAKKTVLITTHYMEEAYLLCDEILIIDKGKAICQGPPRDLVSRYGFEHRVELPARINLPTLSTATSITKNTNHWIIRTSDLSALIKEFIDDKIDLSDLKISEASLEDLFMHLTGHSLRD